MIESISIHDAAERIMQAGEAPQEEAPVIEDTPEPVVEVEAAEDVDDIEEDTEDDTDDIDGYEDTQEIEEPEAEPEEEVALPEGWDDFAELPAAQKKAIAERVTAANERATKAEAAVEAKTKELTEAVEKERASIKDFADFALGQLKAMVPPAPNPALANEDPGEYVRQMAAHQEGVQNVQNAINAHEQYKGQFQAERQKVFSEWAAEQDKLLAEALPEYKTDKDGTNRKLTDYAKSLGYQDDILGVLSASDKHVLWKASKWDELQAKKPAAKEAVKKAPPVVKPGTKAQKSPAQSEIDKLMAKSRRGGLTMQDAARLLELRG